MMPVFCYMLSATNPPKGNQAQRSALTMILIDEAPEHRPAEVCYRTLSRPSRRQRGAMTQPELIGFPERRSVNEPKAVLE